MESKTAEKKTDDVSICSNFATMLSVSEVGLGSLVHAFHLPVAGHILSLNQIFLMSKASAHAGKNGSTYIPATISFIAAALKSLSPAGKKLTPMLAISMQGILYNVGIVLLGHTIAGRYFGACLSSLWGFLQPLLIYYLIMGNALFHVFIRIEEAMKYWVPMDIPSVWYLCIFFVSLKALISIGIAHIAPSISRSQMAFYQEKLKKSTLKKPIQLNQKEKKNPRKVAVLAAKDLLVWPFFACVILSAVSFYWAEGMANAWLLFAILRPIAVGFLFFFTIRMLPMHKVENWLEKRPSSTISKGFFAALKKIREL